MERLMYVFSGKFNFIMFIQRNKELLATIFGLAKYK